MCDNVSWDLPATYLDRTRGVVTGMYHTAIYLYASHTNHTFPIESVVGIYWKNGEIVVTMTSNHTQKRIKVLFLYSRDLSTYLPFTVICRGASQIKCGVVDPYPASFESRGIMVLLLSSRSQVKPGVVQVLSSSWFQSRGI